MDIYWLLDTDIPQDEQDRYLSTTTINGQLRATLTVQEADSSYRNRALMEKPQLVVKFSLPRYIEVPIGAKCRFQGQLFTLNTPQAIKKLGTRNIEYTLTFGTLQDAMGNYKMRNTVDGRLKWSMCAKPHEFIEEIVRNLNQQDRNAEAVWHCNRDNCISADEKTIEFSFVSIEEALQSVAETFETEYEITEDYEIRLGKVEYNKDAPLALAYGRGNGFIPGLGRSSQDDESPILRLYVEGSDRNIDRSRHSLAIYGGDGNIKPAELRLPCGQTIGYDGSKFENEFGFDSRKAKYYTSDTQGFYIYRSNPENVNAVLEEALDCTEVYPSHVCKVTMPITVDSNNNFYDIVDALIEDDMDFDAYRMDGESLSIVFQSGMLAGKEFEVNYHHNSIGGKYPRRFEIKPQEIDGVVMPNPTFSPQRGDKFIVFGMMLPDAYICNNTNKTGAAWNMMKEAVKYLWEHEEQKYTYTGELQGLWSKNNWEQVSQKLRIGSYILFSDPQFCPDGEKIRITAIKEYLCSPYSPVITFSNKTGAVSTVGTQLKKIDNTEIKLENSFQSIKGYTKRRFTDAQETARMLIEAMGQSLSQAFTEGISPITVQTMSALIGDESLQFHFVIPTTINNSTTYTETQCPVSYNTETRELYTMRVCYLQHLTLGAKVLQSQNAVNAASSERQFTWKMPGLGPLQITPEQPAMYLYAICPKTVNTSGSYTEGDWLLTHEAQAFESNNNYYLLVGILSSESAEGRSFVTMYGFTEILPGRITTDRIVSANGKCWFDLAANRFRMGNNKTAIDWNNAQENTLSLLNADFRIEHNNREMIRFNAEDGSGMLAGGNIEWDSNGSAQFRGLIGRKKTIITSDNILLFCTSISGDSIYDLDIRKTGTHIVFQGDLSETLNNPFIPGFYLPSLFTNGVLSGKLSLDELRSFVGQTILLYNNSNRDFLLSGACFVSDDADSANSTTLEQGHMAICTCIVNPNVNVNHEFIGWRVYTKSFSSSVV